MDQTRQFSSGVTSTGPGMESTGTGRWPAVRTRVERLLLGPGLSALAWLLERAVIRSTRRA